MTQLIVMVVALILSVLTYKKTTQIQANKGTSKALTILSSASASFLVFAAVIVIGASIFADTSKTIPKQSSNVQKQNPLEILSVSDYSNTMKGKQSVSISFGTSQTNYYTLTIHRDKVKQGIELKKDKSNYIGSIDCEANFNKKWYVFLIRDNFKSYIDFKINSIDYKNKQATIIVSTKLYNPDDGSEIEIKNQKLSIKDTLFDNFTKQIKNKKTTPVNTELIDVFNYLKDSPQYVFASFINAWASQDFKKMVNYTQLRWKSREKDPINLLKNQYDFKHIKTAEITDVKPSGTAAYKITAHLTYTTPFNDKTDDVHITGMVIKENGVWGVNPISTLREF